MYMNADTGKGKRRALSARIVTESALNEAGRCDAMRARLQKEAERRSRARGQRKLLFTALCWQQRER
jgi:hypothetical protein